MRMIWVGSVAALVGAVAWAAVALPERVPVHYGLDGAPTRWGSKAELLAGMVVGGLVGVATCGALGWAVGSGRVSLSLVNIPHKARWLSTPEGEREVRRRLGADLLGIGAVIGMAMMTLVVATVVQVRDHLPALPVWGNLGMLAMLVLLAAWTVLALTVRYRPPGE